MERIKSWFGRCFRKKNQEEGSPEQITKKMTPLPKAVVAIVFSMIFFAAMAITMVFSFLPKLIKSFGISEVETGYYAGWVAASFFIGRIPCSFLWGWLSDVKGRRFSALLSLSAMSVTTLLFGLSNSYYWTLIFRGIQGCSNGVIIICKALIFVICDDTNLPLAMSVIMASYNVGIIIGPSLAGFLVFPHEQYPSIFSEDNIFSKYPILFPNMIIAVGFIVTIFLLFKWIPKDKKKSDMFNEKNYLLDPIDKTKPRYDNVMDESIQTSDDSVESALSTDDYMNVSVKLYTGDGLGYFQIIEPDAFMIQQPNRKLTLKEKWNSSKMKQVLSNKWCMVSCLLYGMCAFNSVGVDELLPLFLASSREYGGLGMTTRDIGLAYLISAAVMVVLLLTLLTWFSRRFGAKILMLVSLIGFGLAVPFIPLSGFIQNEKARWAALVINILLTKIPQSGQFLAINVIVNNTVGEDLVGSANGLAFGISSIGR
eukprot:TCONS_00003507-protein